MPLNAIDRGVTVLPFSSWGSASGLWHASAHRRLGRADVAYYGTGETGWHGWGASGGLGGGITSGSILSDAIDLSDYPSDRFRVYLRWWQYASFRASASKDLATIAIRVGGSTVRTLAKSETVGTGSGSLVLQGFQTVNISDVAPGNSVRARYQFDSVDAPIGGEGWFVDDVKLLIRRI